jgi:hypothetical protein
MTAMSTTETVFTRKLMVTALLSVQILLTTLSLAAYHRADTLWLMPAGSLVIALLWMRRTPAKIALIGACALVGFYGYLVGDPMPGGHGLREASSSYVFGAFPVILLLSFALGAAEREFALGGSQRESR